MFPSGGTVFVGTTPDNQTQGEVRVVGFSLLPKPLTEIVNRKFVPPIPSTVPGLSGTWVFNVKNPAAFPQRMPQDGFVMIGGYSQPSQFSYRLEFCKGGQWVPVTAPETAQTLAFSERYEDDLYTVTYGSPQDQPTSQNLLTTVIFSFKPPVLEVHVDVEKGKCVGIPGLAAYSDNTVHGYTKDHYTGQPVNVRDLGISMIFDGTTEIVPKPGHGSLNLRGCALIDLPGCGSLLNPGQGYVDTFPYGKISKNDKDTSSVALDDKSFGVHIGGPCRDFTGVTRAVMYDGEVIVSTQHTT